MERILEINTFIVNISRALWPFLILVFIGIYVYGYIKVISKEKRILELEDEINTLENNPREHPYTLGLLKSGALNQQIFEKRVEAKKKPIIAEIKKLKLERQFMLDKLPFVSVFKK